MWFLANQFVFSPKNLHFEKQKTTSNLNVVIDFATCLFLTLLLKFHVHFLDVITKFNFKIKPINHKFCYAFSVTCRWNCLSLDLVIAINKYFRVKKICKLYSFHGNPLKMKYSWKLCIPEKLSWFISEKLPFVIFVLFCRQTENFPGFFMFLVPLPLSLLSSLMETAVIMEYDCVAFFLFIRIEFHLRYCSGLNYYNKWIINNWLGKIRITSIFSLWCLISFFEAICV